MPSYTAGMDSRRHRGGVPVPNDANLLSRSFSMDFSSILETTDGVLHQPINEYLQVPVDHQQFHDDEGTGFSIPYSESLSFAAASPPFQSSISVETLQGSNFMKQSLGSNSHNSGYEIQSKVQYVQMLPTSIGAATLCTPHQQLHDMGFLEPDNFVSELQAPAQPDMLYAGSSQPSVIIPGEVSGYEPSWSPSNFRGTARGSIGPQLDLEAVKLFQKHQVKGKRPCDAIGHIIRERQRRDDMTNKFLLLESVLPPAPKRDRATVVKDSIQYVKNLHHRVKSLQQKRSQMRSKLSNTSSLSRAQIGGMQKHQEKELSTPTNSHALLQTSLAGDDIASCPIKSDRKGKTTEIEVVKVHVDLPHQVVIEMTCRQQPRIQVRVLETLESMGLDVSLCNVSKLQSHLLFSIIAKSRMMVEPPLTGKDIVQALKRAVAPAGL